MSKVVGIYHKNCIDGTAAAAVLLRKYPEAKLFPLSHAFTTEEMNEVLDSLDAETHVYTVDCGVGANEILQRGVRVTTIDHHIGAKYLFENLKKENIYFEYIFDNNKSGASLAWSYFFSDEDEPEVIKYIEDADLWRWQFSDITKDVNSYLSIFRNDPVQMLSFIEGDLDEVKQKGAVISQYADREIESLIKIPSINIKIGPQIVPAFNITTYQSACGNILSEELGSVVAMFTVEGNNVNLSFRSKENQTPTSLELATMLGGGGHVCAAGADITLKRFLKMLV